MKDNTPQKAVHEAPHQEPHDLSYVKDHQLELENRIRNLMWTVSGDYTLDTKVNVETFLHSKYLALYDGIKQGAFAKYFDKDAVGMYLVKKVYMGAQEAALVSVSQMCIEEAICEKVTKERSGVAAIRKQALQDLLELEFDHMSTNSLGRVRIALLKEAIRSEYAMSNQIRACAERLYELRTSDSTDKLIEIIDEMYNRLIDPYFEKNHGSLEQVLAVTAEELTEFSWQDYLSEEMYADNLEHYLESLTDQMTESFTERKKDEEPKDELPKQKVVLAKEEDLKKVYSYVELHFGKTYLSKVEEKRMNFRYCKGIHADCGLYFTEGILKHPVRNNYQYQYALRHREKNKHEYYDTYRIIKRNIKELTGTLQKSLILRDEVQEELSDYGKIVPNRLWRAGRTRQPKLFVRELRNHNMELVVDVLLDASGSQRSRQAQVAIQAYILSEALSNVGIPHRVMSFCTFWDYTILHRFRSYDDPRTENENIFEYNTSSNNRDGLAIAAAADGLLEREEETKLLILLSDGRPNDVIVGRPNARNPRPYRGDYAAKDTAFEVRRLRNAGVAVLGVFAGEEQDLDTEKKIFGKDFAYIRNIEHFSRIVGKYLVRQWEENQ